MQRTMGNFIETWCHSNRLSADERVALRIELQDMEDAIREQDATKLLHSKERATERLSVIRSIFESDDE